MKRLISYFSTIAIITVFVAVGLAQTSERDAVSVMSFNIRYDEPKDGINAWPNRKEKVAEVIKRSGADLIGVQEALKHQLDALLRLLPGFGYCGVGRADGKEGGEYSAILYRKDRFKIKKCETFWLSETPSVAGSKGWDGAFPRIVTWIKVKDRRTGRTFFHFNTHFDHVGEKARLNSASLIVNEAIRIAGRRAFVISGDLNANESSPVYAKLKNTLRSGETVVFDTHYRSETPWSGPSSTFNEFKELKPGMKIDHIFVSANVGVFKAGSMDDRFDGLWASDHIPVFARLVIGRGAK